MSRNAPSPTPGCWEWPPAQAQALPRLALAAAQACGPGLFDRLVSELAAALEVPLVLLAVVTQDGHELRALAVCLDGQIRPTSTSRHRAGAAGCRAVLRDRADDRRGDASFSDSAARALGMLVAMDRRPMAAADAGRVQDAHGGRRPRRGEIERARTDETLRAVALGVSASRGGSVFDELVRLPAPSCRSTSLSSPSRTPDRRRHADPRHVLRRPGAAGHPLIPWPDATATVLGQRFRAYPSGVQALFPDDQDLRDLDSEGYAGHPLAGADGTALGIVAVASRRPLVQPDRVQATLKIFAVQAAAEVERLRAGEAQKQSVEDLRQREEQMPAPSSKVRSTGCSCGTRSCGWWTSTRRGWHCTASRRGHRP